MKLSSPHKFKERILLFGGGGVGKSTSILSIARRLKHGTMHVIDGDYSLSYERALATDFDDVDNVIVYEIDDDFESFVATLAAVIEAADPENDWIAIDPFNVSWEYVQTWMSDQVHGIEIEDHMVKLRAESGSLKEFQQELGDSMNWPLVSKTYTNKVLRPLSRWRGHLILATEAAQTNSRDDDEAKDLFGHLGVKPAGQKRTHHVCSTNILLKKTGHGEHKMTTAKDRNRPEQENLSFDDFGIDYLMNVAGWVRAK